MIKRMVILLLLAWTSSLAWCDEVLLSTDSIDAAKNDSIAMQFRMISRQLDSIAMKINACDALDRSMLSCGTGGASMIRQSTIHQCSTSVSRPTDGLIMP